MKIKKNHGSDKIDEMSYGHQLKSIKTRIHPSQHQAGMYVNSELLYTYWNIGHALNQESERQGCRVKVVDQLAQGLKFSLAESVSSIVLLSVTHIESIDSQENTIVPKPVAQFQLFEKYVMARVPWSHRRRGKQIYKSSVA